MLQAKFFGRRLLLKSFAVAAALVMASAPADLLAQSAKPVVVLLPADPVKLDPPSATDGNSLLVALHVFDRLVDFDEATLKPVPGLAESWDISADGLRYTFHMRKDATFSDGTTVDSAAVKFTFDRIMDEKHPGHLPGFQWSDSILGDWYSHIETPDPATAVFVLKRPFVPMLANLAMPAASIVSPAYTLKMGDQVNTKPMGSGPYMLANWKAGSFVALTARDNHWRGKPANKTLLFQIQKDPNQRLSLIRRGQAHVDFTLDLTALGGKTGDLGAAKLVEVPIGSLGFVYFNLLKPQFKDKRVRQAMNYAIDRQSICDGLLAGTSIPAYGIIPPGMLGNREKRPFQYSFDLEKAKSLMKEAGYGPENPLKVTFSTFDATRPYNVAGSRLAQRLQEDLRKIGVDAKLQVMEFGGLIQMVEERTVHELANMGWMTDTGDPDNFIYEIFGMPKNRANYKNPAAYDLMIAAQGETDTAKRASLYEKAEDLVIEDPPAIFLNHAVRFVAVNKNLEGYVPAKLNDAFWNAHVK